MSGRTVRILAAGIAGSIAACIISTIVYATGLKINGSPSMPPGLYAIHDGFPTKRGSVVVFCPQGVALAYEREWNADENRYGTCPGGATPFLKYAAALPGDRVDLRADGVHVNGGKALPGSVPMRNVLVEHGWHRMPKLTKKTWIIPPGDVWVYTPEWFSFDSRYYGPVRVSRSGAMILGYEHTPLYDMPASVKAIQNK
jgi:conjugative transfer signal peptidase TraF